MPVGTKQTDWKSETQGFGTQIPFAAVHEPGTYVCNWSGHLLRMPADAINPRVTPVMCILGKEALYLTKISDQPFLPITKARVLASECDVAVNF